MGDDDLIPAATVLLLRETTALEVLMVERHENIGFAGGAMVFPGGRVDPGDRDLRWRQFATGYSDKVLDHQVAAIREAFEEAGILLARDQDAARDGALLGGARAIALGKWRAEIEKDDALFLEMIASERLTLACDALHLFAHWVPPGRVHKRFDTLFFAARCPFDQSPQEDGNEATEVVWVTPRGVLADRDAGLRKLIFPTVANLHLLAESETVDGVFDAAHGREIVPVSPAIVERNGEKHLTIPQDCGYPVTEEPLARSFNE